MSRDGWWMVLLGVVALEHAHGRDGVRLPALQAARACAPQAAHRASDSRAPGVSAAWALGVPLGADSAGRVEVRKGALLRLCFLYVQIRNRRRFSTALFLAFPAESSLTLLTHCLDTHAPSPAPKPESGFIQPLTRRRSSGSSSSSSWYSTAPRRPAPCRSWASDGRLLVRARLAARCRGSEVAPHVGTRRHDEARANAIAGLDRGGLGRRGRADVAPAAVRRQRF